VRPEATGADVDAALDAIVVAAQRAWPEVALDGARFVRHIAERLPAQVALPEALAGLHANDLYVACACADGNAAAVAIFEREYLARVVASAARVNRSPDFVDEVRQRLRERLLVGAAPRIADYNGSGPLAGWVRVAVIRTALNLRRDEGVAAR